jgi:isoleucyl-tRNA synthetase
MKQLAAAIGNLKQEDIRQLESVGKYTLESAGQSMEITLDDVEISTSDIPGWSVATDENLTVALDITITDALQQEGIARELVNRVQNLRKDKGLEVTDRIHLRVAKNEQTVDAFIGYKDYICSETLAEMEIVDASEQHEFDTVEIIDGIDAKIELLKTE